eukprot:408643_1
MTSTQSNNPNYTIHPKQSIETRNHLKAISTKQLYHIHRITASDLELQFRECKPFAIAWYHDRDDQPLSKSVVTLKSHPARNVSVQPLSSEMMLYTDLADALAREKEVKRIRNTPHLTEIPQWFECASCRKWRVHFVTKKHFPVVYATSNWTCEMDPPPFNSCSRPQTKPTLAHYSEIQLDALDIQLTLIKHELVVKNPCNATLWLDKAHMLLDRIYRNFDDKYTIIHPFICTYSQSRICIHQLKHQLENNQIQSLPQFARQLRKMFDQAFQYESLCSNAMLVYAQCRRIMSKFALSSEIMNMFPLVVVPRGFKPKNTQNMPALEKPPSVIGMRSDRPADSEDATEESAHNTTTNTRDTAMANVQDANTNIKTMDETKTSDAYELVFNGVWIYLAKDKAKACDIIVMLQDSNRISWKHKREKMFETADVFHGHIVENDSKQLVLDIDDHKEYKSAIWEYHSDMNIQLTFNTRNGDDSKKYEKLSRKCHDIKMQCLSQSMVPNASNYLEKINCCDEYEYNICESRTMKAMNYVVRHGHDDVKQNEWYFHCSVCKESVCACCSLMRFELDNDAAENMIFFSRQND